MGNGEKLFFFVLVIRVFGGWWGNAMSLNRIKMSKVKNRARARRGRREQGKKKKKSER